MNNLLPHSEEKEIRRQAIWSFNALLILCIATGFVSLLGIALLILGKVPPGIITATGGISSNIIVIERLHKISKESNTRLKKDKSNHS